MNRYESAKEMLKKFQDENRMTELMVIQEELKTYPFGDVWEEYLSQCNVPNGEECMDIIKAYEKDVLLKR